jgi:ABC-2 type transport system ATP-binding protein
MSELIIQTENLVKEYKEIRAVNGLNLEVYKGDVFGFLGPNGAGKSTTIRMLLGLIKPSSGSIKIFGKSFEQNRNAILGNIGAIVEKPDFYLYLSAIKNLELLAKLSETNYSNTRLMEILELVGLSDRANSKVKTFSHGMKQRLGLAQALVHDPDLIILDEPTTGLDPKGIKEIRDLINYLSTEKGKTIFHSSHLLHEVEMTCNRMMIMYKGKSVIAGPVTDLLNNRDLKVTFQMTEIEKAKQLLSSSTFSTKKAEWSEDKVVLYLENQEIAPINQLLVNNNIAVSALIPKRSLEEYFLELTTQSTEK